MELNKEFTERTEALFGTDRFERFSSALDLSPVVSIRHNTQKGSTTTTNADNVPWANAAEYLAQRPAFTGDPLFHAGCYYVQEASSMFLEQAVRQYVKDPVRALDLCAAPGGKTTHLLSILPEGSLLTANEPIPLRAQILAENVIKWGVPQTVVTRNEPADFAYFRHFFDLIVVDAPCSGEGMFRKDAFAVEQWSVANVKQCADRQRKILADVWEALCPGGLLVYSTCTFNSEENEECVEWIADELGAEVLPIATDARWNITGNLTEKSHPVYRFIPGYTRGEGFFLALLRKHGDAPTQTPRTQRMQPCTAKQRALVEGWITNSEEFDLLLQNDNIIAVPCKHTATIAALQAKLKVLHAALPVAQIKNNKAIPHHALAMSTALNKEAFACIELTREEALAYLHREALILSGAPIGVLLLTYRGIPIGFAKNIGNRANNMYPSEWRIRKNPIEL